MFSVHKIRKAGIFKFLQFEERSRKSPFSWRISVDGRPYCRNKAASSNSSGIDWKRPQRNNAVMGNLIIKTHFFKWQECLAILHTQIATWKMWIGCVGNYLSSFLAKFERAFLQSSTVFCGARTVFLYNISLFGCYTSQLKYAFLLEENASRVNGQNSLTP